MTNHEPTEQETAIYDALTAGDHDTIEQMRDDAYSADPTPPTTKTGDIPEGWLPPIEQYEVDYSNAWNHYQADHEPPEEEREENTADATHEANTDAAERQEGM